MSPTPPNPNRIDPLAPPATNPEPPQTQLVWFIPDRFKQAAASIVAIAGVGVALLGPTSKIGAICLGVIALGAAWGITSNGTQKR